MNHIDAKGKACPMPVMMAKKEMDTGCEALSITVDNAIAVQNLSRLAESQALPPRPPRRTAAIPLPCTAPARRLRRCLRSC